MPNRETAARGQTYHDLYFGADIGLVDPDIDQIIGFEEERQARKLIMIPSESVAPAAVRQALGSVFNNVYAEGYPPLRMTRDDEEALLDIPHQLAYYRRYADRRFYKGVDYVHFIETLAQRRAAACFANDRASAADIYVNVQPLSGAAANLAVYDTLVDVGDTVMGMDLYQGGHLTHGSEFNFSGKRYHVVSYGVSQTTGKLDYDEIRNLARRHRPKMIIAGFTSYTWAPDWQAFADIAHEVGALLLADISHPAGMVVAGAFPSPVGLADVITFTTHKTLCGPRGACILTTDEELAHRIDMSVFPGEQGGPHTQKFAAMAVAFKIAQGAPFRQMQWQIKANAAALADGLQQRGLGLAYGGTDTHFCMLDLNSVETHTGFPLRGEPAVRILDMAGIVANKNTVPGDTVTSLAMGIRLGTPWLTQRGFGPAEMDRVAALIHRTVTSIQPFSYVGLSGELPRGKLALETFEEIKAGVAELAAQGAAETRDRGTEYPHYYRLAPEAAAVSPAWQPAAGPGQDAELAAARTSAVIFDTTAYRLLEIIGDRATPSLAETLTCDVAALAPGQCRFTYILDKDACVMDDTCLMRLPADAAGCDHYVLRTQPANHDHVKAWLRALGDGYTLFDREDLLAKIEGPIIVEDLGHASNGARCVPLVVHGPQATAIVAAAHLPAQVSTFQPLSGVGHVELVVPAREAQNVYGSLVAAGAVPASRETFLASRKQAGLPEYGPDMPRPTALQAYRRANNGRFELRKPYFIGQRGLAAIRSESQRTDPDRPEFTWTEPENAPLKRTALYEWHKAHTRKIIPFAGWEMPVWYTGVLDEHNAVRKAAGLFDVSHMGVFEVSGPHAAEFLDLVCTNYARWYAPGESFYAYLLDPDGAVIDDLLVYHRRPDVFQVVVNASNADKDWAWLNAVNNGEVLLDRARPDVTALRPARLRNLKDPSSGEDMRVDLALQGPASLAILQAMANDAHLAAQLRRVRKTGVLECTLAGFDLVLARTGYTGEDVGYELFTHPDQAAAFWEALLAAGQPFGGQPAGLAARDSTRTEAGLPLYGHELAGHFGISPAGAGFAAYVKLHKPYFIGRGAYLSTEKGRTMQVARFRMNERGVRMPKTGDPVITKKGQAIGWVTSAAVDVDGIILGLAYVQSRFARPGDEIGVYSLPPRPALEKPNKADLSVGDKVSLPDAATLLPRFPDQAERAHWRATSGSV
jgi:glycine cleavage system T protein